jgi:small-conductance mechanosensitive channel
VIGIGIGFGLQNIASNFISGLLIGIERPIKAGDFVDVGEHRGTVQRIGARSTSIVTSTESRSWCRTRTSWNATW